MVKVITTDEQFSQWLLQFLPQLLDPEFDLQPGEVGQRAPLSPVKQKQSRLWTELTGSWSIWTV